MENRFDEIDEKIISGDPFEPELQQLMEFKVRKVLLVATLWDYFMMEEDGRLIDALGIAYKEHDLGYVPILHRVDDGKTALKELEEGDFDLVITAMRLRDMNPYTLGQRIKYKRPDLPVILLAFDTPELYELIEENDEWGIDKVFIWQGDGNIIIGIIKYIEDMKNAPHDCELAGVQCILLVEDSIHFYSKYLHVLYEELWMQIRRLLNDDLPYTLRKTRQRKRPRVLLANNYEDGVELFDRFKNQLMGVITDIEYPVDGHTHPDAGLMLARHIRENKPEIPVLMQSSDQAKKEQAKSVKAGFLYKLSPTLIKDFRKLLLDRFYFGDLNFRDGGNKVIAKASNLDTLVKVIKEIPDDMLIKYLKNGDLVRWLRARTDIRLADRIAEIDFRRLPPEEVEEAISELVKNYRRWVRRGSITNYSPKLFKAISNFSRIGNGSIGGKARGLAFIDRSLAAYMDTERYKRIQVSIPTTLVLATEIFDKFIEKNNLLKTGLDRGLSNQQIVDEFVKHELPSEIMQPIRDFLKQVKVPLAVRSSSLLEDALYQPFAGIYATILLPNDHEDDEVRLNTLLYAVKCIYASTYFKNAKAFIRNTNYHTEDEKMAVIIQEVHGKPYEDRFYPDFSGVARSYNYYPFGGAKPEEGIVNLALGLGKTIVDGGMTINFSPSNPKVLPQFKSAKDMFDNSQKEFWALKLGIDEFLDIENEEQYMKQYPINEAEKDGVLNYTGSTYSVENDTVSDGIVRSGPRIVNFAHILKNEVFPLNSLIKDLLTLGEHAMGFPVEIEFSVTLNHERVYPVKFSVLQIRPCISKAEVVDFKFDDFVNTSKICQSDHVLGNGEITTIRDILYVKPDSFDPSKTPVIADEVGEFNKTFKDRDEPYLLIGPGRWGSSESWLGIPVEWNQIDQAKVIIEAAHDKMNPDPSQGSHFFHNITSLRIGYFTIPKRRDKSFIDWNWLKTQKSVEETSYLKHVKLDNNLMIKIDGRKGIGIILKPDVKGVMSRMFPINKMKSK